MSRSLESFQASQGGFAPSIANIYIAGLPVVNDIVTNWDSTYAAGIAPQGNFTYDADDLHTLSMGKRAGMRKRASGGGRVRR